MEDVHAQREDEMHARRPVFYAPLPPPTSVSCSIRRPTEVAGFVRCLLRGVSVRVGKT